MEIVISTLGWIFLLAGVILTIYIDYLANVRREYTLIYWPRNFSIAITGAVLVFIGTDILGANFVEGFLIYGGIIILFGIIFSAHSLFKKELKDRFIHIFLWSLFVLFTIFMTWWLIYQEHLFDLLKGKGVPKINIVKNILNKE